MHRLAPRGRSGEAASRTRRGSWRPPRGDEAGGARRCGRAPSQARTCCSRRPQRRRKWRHRGRSRRPEPRSREPASLAAVPSSRVGGQRRRPAVGSAAETLVSGGRGPDVGGRRTGARGGRSALRAATWLVITLSHRCPPVPGPVRAGSHLRARVTEGELSLRGPQGGHTLAGGHARAARSPAGPRLALTGREPVSPRIIGHGDVTGPRGRSLWGQVPDTPQVCATPQPRPAAPPSLRRAVTFLLLLLDPDTCLARHLLAGPSRAPKRQGPPPTGACF